MSRLLKTLFRSFESEIRTLLKRDQNVTTNRNLMYPKTLGDRDFRLLRLLPGKQDDELKCELIDACLNDPPAFAAISVCLCSVPRVCETDTDLFHRSVCLGDVGETLHQMSRSGCQHHGQSCTNTTTPTTPKTRSIILGRWVMYQSRRPILERSSSSAHGRDFCQSGESHYLARCGH